MDWRLFLIIAIMTLSLIDLIWTAYYIHTYKSWQPNKPYNLMELNPLLVFLWTRLGFWIGMIVGSIIILSLVFIVAKYSHWTIALLMIIILSWAMYNHYGNTTLLHQLIEKYPSGSLPTEALGVESNNIK